MALGTIEETPCPSRGLEFRGSVVAVPCEHTECRHLGQHLHNRQIQMRVAGGAASRDSFFLWVVLGKKAPPCGEMSFWKFLPLLVVQLWQCWG